MNKIIFFWNAGNKNIKNSYNNTGIVIIKPKNKPTNILLSIIVVNLLILSLVLLSLIISDIGKINISKISSDI